jgi:GH24 family phage-related lysozyme (muramidase)
MNNGNTFSDGIGDVVRGMASGDRTTPAPEQQGMGFYIGTVMDDADDQRMGQVWVYIPAFSGKRLNEGSVPTEGTVSDRKTGQLEFNQKLRLGWIQCYPLMPFFGSDGNRVKNSTGRNAYNGDTSSYGFWANPRIGDQVGILFSHGDIARAYWIGAVPKYYSNISTPAIVGVGQEVIDPRVLAESLGGKEIPKDALIPTLEKTRDVVGVVGATRRFDEVYPARSYFANLMLTGLINDSFRGAGLSSARRESPSYVTGLKSPGWDYDSEKNNVNATTGDKFDGTAVGKEPAAATSRSRYLGVSSDGHQFVMDDHPDNQSLRIRTSAGSQIYFNDGGTTGESANDAFIYISTAKGKVWIEMQDDGDLNVYGAGSGSFHFEGDLNLTAGKAVNIEAGTDLNFKAKSHSMDIAGASNEKYGSKDIESGSYSINASGGAANITAKSLNISLSDEYKVSAGAGIHFTATSAFRVKSGADISLIGKSIAEEASSINVHSSGAYRETAPAGIFMNSGTGQSATAASPASPAGTATIPGLNTVAPPPSEKEISLGKEPEANLQKLAPVVPQHQPWSGRTTSTLGFNGFVDENVKIETRAGSSILGAPKPLTIVGRIFGNPEPTVNVGKEYTTDNIGEKPDYEDLGTPTEGLLEPVEGRVASDRLRQFLHTKEKLITVTAYLDAGKAWAIGYGHNIIVGDIINGNVVDKAFIAELYRTNGRLSITEAEGNRLFDKDLRKFEKGVRDNVDVEVTQGQFDAMVSLSYNIGVTAFAKSTALRRLNSGNLEEVPENWMRFNQANGKFNKGLNTRRRQELEQFFSAADTDTTST